MAYDKNKLYKQALQVIEKNKLFFVEDVVAYLPCSKPTLYELFPIDSDELNTIKEELEKNKTEIKVSMRSKWYKSDNPTLQMGLMKLIGTEEEAHRLNGSRQEINQTLTTLPPTLPPLKVNDEANDSSSEDSEANS